MNTTAPTNPILLLCAACALTSISAQAAESLTPVLPSGFALERVSGPEVRFPMFATLDERRRLYVTESSGEDLYAELQKSVRHCRVRRLEDRDGDGRYEAGVIFAEGLVPSMGLVWRDGKLYIADPPDLITLEDTDGDGRADKRNVLLTGFGHRDNGSLHGLIFGPDGWLYFTMGDSGGYQVRRSDGTVLEGRSGALFRCRPDGGQLEVVARGFENLVEVVFLPSGEMIGTDNWYQLPADGIRDALVHLLEGGLYPYAPDAGTPQPVTGEPLPPLALYPAVALSGLEVYRGTNFPAAMRGNLFSAHHNSRKIVRHQLSRTGSTFRSTDEDFIWTDDPDFHPSDVLEDADGSLLVVDTGSWYVHHCPTGRIRQSPAPGGIYRARWKAGNASNASPPAPMDPLDALAAEIRGLGRRAETNSAPKLNALLRHEAPHVRLAAAEALARCGSASDVPELLARLSDPSDRHLEHALTFALFKLAQASQLQAALSHPSPRVQRAALVILDQEPFNLLSPESAVARAFSDDEPLRSAAQKSLRRHAEWVNQTIPVVDKLIAKGTPTSAELDSLGAFVVAFVQTPPIAALVAKAVSDEAVDPALRVTLLQAMAKTSREKLPAPCREAFSQALRSANPRVRNEALRGVNTLRLDGLEGALKELARDPHADPASRIQALRASIRPRSPLDDDVFGLLLGELTATNTPNRRLASVEILGAARMNSAQITSFIKAVTSDPMVSPGVVLGALPWTRLDANGSAILIQYLRSTLKAGWALTETNLNAALQAVTTEAASELAEMRAEVRRARERQQEQLVLLEPLLTGGHVERGRTLFETKVGCANCHRVAGYGGIVGPDLTKIGAIRAGRDLIESIVMPNATFAQGYDTYTATFPDGESVTGIRVVQPDDSIVLRDAAGTETRLPGGTGAKLERQNLSLMPEGLLSTLKESEISDLLAYLQSLK